MNQEWNKKAANLLKSELALAGVGYAELITLLKTMGIDENYKGIANKINRGTFSFIFFMQCMQALGKESIKIEK